MYIPVTYIHIHCTYTCAYLLHTLWHVLACSTMYWHEMGRVHAKTGNWKCGISNQSMVNVSLTYMHVCYFIRHNLQHTIHSWTQIVDSWRFQWKNIACWLWGLNTGPWHVEGHPCDQSQRCLTCNISLPHNAQGHTSLPGIAAKKSSVTAPLPKQVFHNI